VFEAKCAGCHAADAASSEATDKRLPLDKIQTDPIRATSFANKVGRDLFSTAIGDKLKVIKEVAYKRAKITDAEAKEMEKGRTQVEWRTTREYPNRPLVAAWATAPYLHNASVPTIADLLTPAERRPACFLVGSREYDPKKLGYKYAEGQDCNATAPAGLFLLKTTEPGNGNKGHSGSIYGTDLPDDQKEALLEYLKTI
jgi:hypothetical protein